jgi:hypothetical protein
MNTSTRRTYRGGLWGDGKPVEESFEGGLLDLQVGRAVGR